MKHLKLFFALFAMLALGVSNAWAETATITFKNQSSGTSDGSSEYSTSNFVSSGIASSDAAFGTITCSATSKCYSGKTGMGLKAGGSSAAGSFTITFSTPLVNVSKVTLNAAAYRSDRSVDITVKNGSTQLSKITSITNTTLYDIDIADLNIASFNTLTIESTKYCYIKSITITYNPSAGGETPEPDPDPTPDPEPEPEPGTGGTGTINFNNSAVKINAASVTGDDNLGNTWTITTVGTTSYTASSAYYQVGSGSKPATSITFTTTLPSEGNITAFSAKFGGFSGTAGTVTLKVGETSVGTGTISSSADVIVENSESATGKVLTVTVTDISKGVKVYYISYTYTVGGAESTTVEVPAEQFAWSASTAEATMPNTIENQPTLTNALSLPITYSSSTPATATIDANTGAISLVAAGTTTINAIYTGGADAGDGKTYAAKTVSYTLTVNKAPATPTENVYVKVTSTAGITDGEYLIVYEAGNVAFDGSLTTLDAVSNTIEVEITDGTIAGTNYIDAATFTIDNTAGTLKSASGKYIGVSSNSNGLKTEDAVQNYKNAFSIDDSGNAVIAAVFDNSNMSLRYNEASNQARFRYYGSGQKAIALYKKASKHTVTIADCTNGSVSAKMGETALATNDQVLSGIQITLSNEAATGYKLAAYDVYKTGEESTKVTVTDGKFIMPEFDVTISATFEAAKTLNSIEITTPATQITFWQGEAFNHDGLKVTAHFDGAEAEDVTDKVTVTGSTAIAGAAVEVTVSFTEGTTTKTTEYNITVKATANTKETAYDVTTAREIIDKVSTADNVYVTGIVSEIVTPYNSEYGNITYNISADGLTTSNQLQAFRGKSYNGENFTSADDIQVGDEVIVKGDLLKFGSIYELNANNQLVNLKRDKQQAGLAYAVTELAAEVGATDFAEPELTNPNDLSVEYSTSDATLATVNATTGEVTIGNKAGIVVITASFAGDENYVAGSASYTINITDPNVSEATFVAGTDKSDTKSISKNGITVEFTDGSFDRDDNYRCYVGQSMTISYADGNITKIVIECTANDEAQYGPGQFTTETATYSYSGKVGTWTGEANSVTFTAGTQVRMTTITVYYKQDTRTPAGIAWNPATVSLTVGDAFTAPTFNNPNELTGIEFTSSNTELATVDNAGLISLVSGKTGSATITAIFGGNENYKPAEVTCTITVDHKSEDVVILAKCKDQYYALVAEYLKSEVLKALPVEYVNGKIYNVETDEQKAAITWKRVVLDGKTTFKNGEYYLSAVGGSAALDLGTEACEWVFEANMYKTEASSTRTILYYTSTGGFKNYATSNMSNDGVNGEFSSAAITVAPVFADGDAYHRTVTSGNYGTMCIPYGSSNYMGAEFYEISWMEMDGTTPKGIWLDQVNGALTAGKPYIFKATASEIAIVGDGTTAATPVEGVAGLTGTFTLIQDIETSDPSNTLEGNYMIAGNKFLLCGAGCWLNANRAYIDASIIANHTTKKAEIPGRRRVCMGETSENEATGFENIVAPEGQAVKAIVNGQLIIIRDGVMYNVQGQKL